MHTTFRTTAIVLLAALWLAAPAAAQEPEREELSSFVEGRVTFKLPTDWAVQKHVSTKSDGRAQLLVPLASADKKAHNAAGSLVAHLVPDRVTLRDLSDGVYKNHYEGLAVLSDTFDGDNWRTVVWTAKVDVPYVMLHRFGLVNRVAVELWLALPAAEAADAKQAERIVADFNALCESLKVDGQNKFDGKLSQAKISELLKVKR